MLVNLEEKGDWKPLIMTIVNVVLIGTSLTLMVHWRLYGGGSPINDLWKAGMLLSMLTIVTLLVSLVCLLYDKLRTSRTLLAMGILLLLVNVVIKTLDWIW